MICLKSFVGITLLFSMAMVAAAESLQPIATAACDNRGRIVVNGKPFFPILLYDAPNDPASLDLFHEFGFNTLVVARPEDADRLPAHGLYAAVHVAGKKIENLHGVLLGIGMDSPALYLKEQLLKRAAEDLAQARAQVANRPVMHAIGYWLDEPAGVIANAVPPREKYEDLVQVLDVAAPYLYPIPHQPVQSVGKAVGRAASASGGKKPVLPILQLFVWDGKDRYPTPAELKCMVYLSLIHGARGIGYYSYGSVTGKRGTSIAAEQPVLWRSVRALNTEVAAIGALLLEASPDSAVQLSEGSPAVELCAVTCEPGGLILLANTAAESKAVTLQFGPRAPETLIRVDGDAVIRAKGVAVTDGKVKLLLDPFGTVALRW